MAKTIKFNLLLDENPVRDLESLRKNFLIEDILNLFNNGLLERWLKVRGYDEILEKVEKIKVERNIDIITELIKIFEIEVDENKIKEAIQIFEYKKEREFQLKQYEKLGFREIDVIDDYHSGYQSIINNLIENEDNMPIIKANINEIENKYLGLFDLNYRDLYYYLIENAPLAIFAILMNNKLRSYFIATDYSNENTIGIYKDIKRKLIGVDMLKERLGHELKVFKGNTDAYWKDLEPSDKKVMIINIKDGNFLRCSGKFGEELSSNDINNKFIIIEGIDYKSNYSHDELLYMEV